MGDRLGDGTYNNNKIPLNINDLNFSVGTFRRSYNVGNPHEHHLAIGASPEARGGMSRKTIFQPVSPKPIEDVAAHYVRATKADTIDRDRLDTFRITAAVSAALETNTSPTIISPTVIRPPTVKGQPNHHQYPEEPKTKLLFTHYTSSNEKDLYSHMNNENHSLDSHQRYEHTSHEVLPSDVRHLFHHMTTGPQTNDYFLHNVRTLQSAVKTSSSQSTSLHKSVYQDHTIVYTSESDQSLPHISLTFGQLLRQHDEAYHTPPSPPMQPTKDTLRWQRLDIECDESDIRKHFEEYFFSVLLDVQSLFIQKIARKLFIAKPQAEDSLSTSVSLSVVSDALEVVEAEEDLSRQQLKYAFGLEINQLQESFELQLVKLFSIESKARLSLLNEQESDFHTLCKFIQICLGADRPVDKEALHYGEEEEEEGIVRLEREIAAEEEIMARHEIVTEEYQLWDLILLQESSAHQFNSSERSGEDRSGQVCEVQVAEFAKVLSDLEQKRRDELVLDENNSFSALILLFLDVSKQLALLLELRSIESQRNAHEALIKKLAADKAVIEAEEASRRSAIQPLYESDLEAILVLIAAERKRLLNYFFAHQNLTTAESIERLSIDESEQSERMSISGTAKLEKELQFSHHQAQTAFVTNESQLRDALILEENQQILSLSDLFVKEKEACRHILKIQKDIDACFQDEEDRRDLTHLEAGHVINVLWCEHWTFSEEIQRHRIYADCDELLKSLVSELQTATMQQQQNDRKSILAAEETARWTCEAMESSIWEQTVHSIHKGMQQAIQRGHCQQLETIFRGNIVAEWDQTFENMCSLASTSIRLLDIQSKINDTNQQERDLRETIKHNEYQSRAQMSLLHREALEENENQRLVMKLRDLMIHKERRLRATLIHEQEMGGLEIMQAYNHAFSLLSFKVSLNILENTESSARQRLTSTEMDVRYNQIGDKITKHREEIEQRQKLRYHCEHTEIFARSDLVTMESEEFQKITQTSAEAFGNLQALQLFHSNVSLMKSDEGWGRHNITNQELNDWCQLQIQLSKLLLAITQEYAFTQARQSIERTEDSLRERILTQELEVFGNIESTFLFESETILASRMFLIAYEKMRIDETHQRDVINGIVIIAARELGALIDKERHNVLETLHRQELVTDEAERWRMLSIFASRQRETILQLAKIDSLFVDLHQVQKIQRTHIASNEELARADLLLVGIRMAERIYEENIHLQKRSKLCDSEVEVRHQIFYEASESFENILSAHGASLETIKRQVLSDLRLAVEQSEFEVRNRYVYSEDMCVFYQILQKQLAAQVSLLACETAQRQDIVGLHEENYSIIATLYASAVAMLYNLNQNKVTLRALEANEDCCRLEIEAVENQCFTTLMAEFCFETSSLQSILTTAALFHQEAEEDLARTSIVNQWSLQINELWRHYLAEIQTMRNQQIHAERLHRLQIDEQSTRSSLQHAESDSMSQLFTFSAELFALVERHKNTLHRIAIIGEAEASERFNIELHENNMRRSVGNYIDVINDCLQREVQGMAQRTEVIATELNNRKLIESNESVERDGVSTSVRQRIKFLTAAMQRLKKELSVVNFNESIARSRLENDEISARNNLRRMEVENKMIVTKLLNSRLAAEERHARLAKSKSAPRLAEPKADGQYLIRKAIGSLADLDLAAAAPPRVGSPSLKFNGRATSPQASFYLQPPLDLVRKPSHSAETEGEFTVVERHESPSPSALFVSQYATPNKHRSMYNFSSSYRTSSPSTVSSLYPIPLQPSKTGQIVGPSTNLGPITPEERLAYCFEYILDVEYKDRNIILAEESKALKALLSKKSMFTKAKSASPEHSKPTALTPSAFSVRVPVHRLMSMSDEFQNNFETLRSENDTPVSSLAHGARSIKYDAAGIAMVHSEHPTRYRSGGITSSPPSRSPSYNNFSRSQYPMSFEDPNTASNRPLAAISNLSAIMATMSISDGKGSSSAITHYADTVKESPTLLASTAGAVALTTPLQYNASDPPNSSQPKLRQPPVDRNHPLESSFLIPVSTTTLTRMENSTDHQHPVYHPFRSTASTTSVASMMTEPDHPWSFGLKLTEEHSKNAEYPRGLRVVKVTKPSEGIISVGDTILSVDGIPVTSQQSMRKATACSEDGLVSIFLVKGTTGQEETVWVQGIPRF